MGWLSGVPLGALYALIFGAALLEGILPIMPGDAAAALVAFLAARAGGALAPTIFMVTCGSLSGALIMWWIGRWYGTEWIAHQIGRFSPGVAEQTVEQAERRVEDAYRRYGWIALFVSRFVPGVRAVVPAAAGALRIPLWEVMAIFSVASTLWYGGISWIAFRVGADWPSVRATIKVVARDVSVGAVIAGLVLVFVGWRLWRRRKRAKVAEPPTP
jgi:membrane protein DedA with SNARE-associated domain